MHQTEDANMDSAPPPDTDTDEISIVDLLLVIVRHKKMILLTTFGAAVITIIFVLLLPNIYTATTLILPAQEDKGMMSAIMGQMGGLAAIAGGAGVSIGGPTTTDLYVSMVKSEAVKDPIIDRFRLMEVYKEKYRTDAYKDLDKKVAVSAGKKDGIITIYVDDKDPKRAAEMANAYVEELGKLAIRLNVTGAGQNRTFLEERLSKTKADLAKAEENLKTFQTKNKAVQVTAQAQATIQGVAALSAQLALQEVQLATYRRKFTESSQEVKNLATSVGNLRAQIARLEGTGGNSSIPSVGSMPAIGQEYVRLMREFKIQESLVELLTKQYEMASFSEAKDFSPLQVLQKAKVPERKSKPKRSLIVILASFTALIFSLLIAFIREFIIRLPEEERERWKVLRAGLSFYRRGNAV
jgi:tyrosine-protein kinase Etk/Wzc